MSSSSAFLSRYWSTPELAVVDSCEAICDKCNTINFASFRAANTFDETFRPTTFILGDFPTLSKSAFAGCPVCRLIIRTISQTATTLYDCVGLNEIAKIGLRLNLDDELSLHCWTSDGSIYPLLGRDALVLKLEDGDTDAETSTMREGYEWKEFGSPKLKILAHTGSNEFIPNIDPDPDVLMNWLVLCSITHDRCSDWMAQCEDSQGLPILPTRVLHLNHEKGARLVETNNGKSQYVTLSHCWGQSQHSYKLNQYNKASMMAGIDVEDLPKTFKEAVKITMRMGFQYLWIDSMCIIQPTANNYEDWEKEGPCMADYYRNSVFTIAASGAVDSDWGCLFRAPSSQYKVRSWPLFKDPIQRKWDDFSLAMDRESSWLPNLQPEPSSWLWQIQNCPLSSRAWVLQERLLSKRILHCTLQGLMWECPDLRASESEPLGCRFDYAVRDEELAPLDEAWSAGADFIIGRYWRQVVERFSKLDITHISDRLPALAGLAKAINQETGERYFAGLWEGSLLPGLLWFRIQEAGSPAPNRLPNAPSWTWAATSAQVKFTSLDKPDYPQRDSDKYTITAELLGVTVQPLSSNIFSWVSASSLRLRGRLRMYEPMNGWLEMRAVNKSVSDCWYGYTPSKFRDEGGSITNIFVPPMPDNDAKSVPEEVALQMAEVVSDHDLLQACIKSEVSQALQDHDFEAPTEEVEPDKLECVFDVAEDEARGDFFLLEILHENRDNETLQVSEGLLLTAVQNKASYTRVGFFAASTKRILFAESDTTEVKLE